MEEICSAVLIYTIESLYEAALQIGIEPKLAYELVLNTGSGSIELAKTSELTLKELISSVCSPGGTTEAGMRILAGTHDIMPSIISTIQEATKAERP